MLQINLYYTIKNIKFQKITDHRSKKNYNLQLKYQISFTSADLILLITDPITVKKKKKQGWSDYYSNKT